MLFLGDIEQGCGIDFIHVKMVIKSHPEYYSNQNIIQLGDFGVGYLPDEIETNSLKGFNDFLKEYNIVMYVCRGNHDNPKYFKGDHIYDNLKFIPDYSVIRIEDRNIFFNGGAHSVNRCHLIEGKTYWRDEQMFYDENKLRELRDIDFIVSHVAPDFCAPKSFNNFVKKFICCDDQLEFDLIKERELATKMFNILKENNYIKTFAYGHYHFSKLQYIETTKFVLLAENEFYKQI